MKKYIGKIQEGISIVSARVMITGDPSFLRMRHREQEVRIRELERENERLEERIRRRSSGTDSPPWKYRMEKAAAEVPGKEKENGLKISPKETPPYPQGLLR